MTIFGLEIRRVYGIKWTDNGPEVDYTNRYWIFENARNLKALDLRKLRDLRFGHLLKLYRKVL